MFRTIKLKYLYNKSLPGTGIQFWTMSLQGRLTFSITRSPPIHKYIKEYTNAQTVIEERHGKTYMRIQLKLDKDHVRVSLPDYLA